MKILQIEIYCAMCGEVGHVACKIEDAKIDLKKNIERAGWITQQNGDEFDIYCSKKCAS